MEDEEIQLVNVCTDLVSAKKNEPFPTELLTSYGSGQWVNVEKLCQQLQIDANDLDSNLFVTWLVDPLSNDEYAVIFFYDEDSKWTMAAHYNRHRVLNAGVARGLAESKK